MSFNTIAGINGMGALQGNKLVTGLGVPEEQMSPQDVAFESQMRMAQNLFGEGAQSAGGGGSQSSFDTSFVNDALMFEAMTTINRLMNNEAGLSRQRTLRSGMGKNSQIPQSSAVVLPMEVGSLSAQFESGGAGVAAIGYDRVGGTSYGKFQIASKTGTMDRFLSYLDETSPEWADRLRAAGTADTGSTEGGMPAVWKDIASENPELFEKMQHDFIGKENYDPARNMILQQTGLDFDNAPSALREVLWSTSVQHGPTGAAKIFGKVIGQFVDSARKGDFNAKLIEGVYDTRKGQFGSSSKRVQQSVVSRMNEEKQLALNLLENAEPLSRVV